MTDSLRKVLKTTGYVVGSALLLGAMLWIGFAQDKAMAILLAIAALIAARILYVNVPRFLASEDEETSE